MMANTDRRRLSDYGDPWSYLRQQHGCENISEVSERLDVLRAELRERQDDIEDITEALMCYSVAMGSRLKAKGE